MSPMEKSGMHGMDYQADIDQCYANQSQYVAGLLQVCDAA